MLQAVESELVFINDDKPVTDSLTIAHAFEKKHDKVLRDIRTLKCSESFRLTNFGESSYENKQGRKMPSFIVTQDGFAMLAMGYNGEKAMTFKERYINEFNRTRHILESRIKEQLLLEMQSDATLLSHEQKQIQAIVASVINYLCPTSSHYAKRKYFSKLYNDLKKRYEVKSFRDIRRVDLQDAIRFIQTWSLSTFIWHSPNLESRRREHS
jgi:Rha family phage regulatory protein